MAGTIVANTINTDTGIYTTLNAYQGIAKAWVDFSCPSSTVTINGSFNVSSITRNGAGDWTVNFNTAMTNANYVMAGSGTGVNGSDYPTWISFICNSGTSTPIVKTTTQARVGNFSGYSGAPGYKDSSSVNLAFFGI